MKKLVMFLVKAIGGLVVLILLAIVALNIYLSTRPAGKTMKAAGIISIPTPFRLGRPFIDYMAISGSRLYAGYASNGLVGVVDTATNQAVATVDGLTRVHGIAIVADRNLGFASSSGDNVVGVFDLTTNKLLQKIPAGDGPDAIIYDERAHLVYVANHNGKTGMMIDPATQKVVATIPLAGEPEYPQADPDTGLIYQNLEDTSQLVVIDPLKGAVVKRYKLDPGEGPTGLVLDAAHHRLFSTTRNKKLIVMNAETGSDCRSSPHWRGSRWRGIRSRPAPRLLSERCWLHDRHSAGFRRPISSPRKRSNPFRRPFPRRGPRHPPRLRGLFWIDCRVRSRALNQSALWLRSNCGG